MSAVECLNACLWDWMCVCVFVSRMGGGGVTAIYPFLISLLNTCFITKMSELALSNYKVCLNFSRIIKILRRKTIKILRRKSAFK